MQWIQVLNKQAMASGFAFLIKIKATWDLQIIQQEDRDIY